MPGKLLGGCYPGDIRPKQAERKLRAIIDSGVRTFVNLMEPGETNYTGTSFVPYEPMVRQLARQCGVDVSLVRMPVRDQNVPAPEFMDEILDTIDASLGGGNPVYAHCWGGRGRTGTVVGCYLARHGIARGEAALRRVTKLSAGTADSHFPAPHTRAQNEMVRRWPAAARTGTD